MKTILKAGILGGLIVYIWGVVSWMALPWHTLTLGKFADYGAVAEVIQENAGASGIYILPNPHVHEDGLSKEKREHFMEQGMERMKQGPFMFAAVSLEGADPASPTPYLSNLLLQIVMAMLIAWLLLQANISCYKRRVLMVVLIGAIAGTQGHLVNAMWWRFSMEYTLVNIADLLISWFLAGLLIARFTVPAQDSTTSE